MYRRTSGWSVTPVLLVVVLAVLALGACGSGGEAGGQGDVKGDTVVIWYAGPPDTFDKFAPRAQKVVDSVKWSG